MKIKLDENLPQRLAVVLARLGHDVDTVGGEGLVGKADDRIWRAAQAAERLLITQDLDFSDIRKFQPGTHGGLLLVRLRGPGRKALFHRIRAVFQTEDAESFSGCFIVVTEHKLRIRRPHGLRIQERPATYSVRRRRARV